MSQNAHFEDRVKVHVLKSLLLAIPLTVVFYFLIYLINLLLRSEDSSSYIYTLFYERESMPYLCTYCTWASLMLLYFRNMEFKRDFVAVNILEDYFTGIGRIGKENTDQIVSDLDNNHAFHIGSLTSSRFLRLMQHIKTGSSWAETESLVKGMAVNDQDAVESSYTWVKFLIWFIPILGFIGTVLGIGAAIGGFNSVLNGSGGFESMKNDLGGITSSLSYAFDSTLVALMQDALIMFLISHIQKTGDNLLIRIDEVFTDDVLVRLEHVEQETAIGGGIPLSDEAIEVFDRFSASANNLASLAKLDSFESTMLDIKNAIQDLTPILNELRKKRKLVVRVEEVDGE